MMVFKRVQFLSLMIFCLVFLFLSPNLVLADLTIGDYSLVSKVRVGRTVYEYTYNASVTNTEVDTIGAVVSDLESLSPNINVVEGRLTFGEVASGKTVESDDTFTIRVNRTYSFNEADLQWTIVPLAGSYAMESGTVSLPSNIPIASGQYKVQAGLSESVVSVSGAFDVRIKADATSLLELVDNEEGNVVYLSLLPQDELLAERELVLDAHSTAVAMVYLQPGITVSDSIIAAIQIALIERLPEVQTLASRIEDSAKTGVPPVTSPNDEIFSALQAAIEAYINYMEAQDYLTLNLKLRKKFFAAINYLANVEKAYAAYAVGCDTLSTIFAHVGTTEDKLCVDMTGTSVEQLGGDVTTINHSCRWVFHYIDDFVDDSQVINDEYGIVGCSLPKRWVLAPIYELSLNLMEDWVQQVFKGRDALELAEERVQQWQSPQRSNFEIRLPKEGAYTFSSYSIGKGLVELSETANIDEIDRVHFYRTAFPALFSIATGLIFPAVETIFNVSDLIDNRYWDFKSTRELQKTFVLKYGDELFLILSKISSDDPKTRREAMDDALSLAIKFVTDPDFIELLNRNTDLYRRILPEKRADYIHKKLKPISPFLAIHGAIEQGAAVADFVKDITSNVDARDLYVLRLESEAPTCGVVDSPYTGVPYTVIDLGSLVENRYGAPTAINDFGQVIGASWIASNIFHAFLWENGVMIDLGTLGGSRSIAWDINNSGQIVGSAETDSGATHAFLWENGVMTDLGTLGGCCSDALGINNSGQIVGVSDATTDGIHGFLWENGQMTDLGHYHRPYAINDSGQTVGQVYNTDSGYYHAALWENGQMTDLGSLFGESESVTAATDINNSGQVIGYSYNDEECHSFLWENGQMTDLCTNTEAIGINDFGQIVGASWTYPDELYNKFYNAVLWQNGMSCLGETILERSNLNEVLVDSVLDFTLLHANDINNSGQVVGTGTINGEQKIFLLTPIPGFPLMNHDIP